MNMTAWICDVWAAGAGPRHQLDCHGDAPWQPSVTTALLTVATLRAPFQSFIGGVARPMV
jgi:hypothetical protein